MAKVTLFLKMFNVEAVSIFLTILVGLAKVLSIRWIVFPEPPMAVVVDP